MDPVPRHPGLDEQLARWGPLSEIMGVYADWLLEQGHPLGEWLVDARLAATGDTAAQDRHLEQRLEALQTEEYLPVHACWQDEVVVGLDGLVREQAKWLAPDLLYEEAWFRLASSVRLELGDPSDTGNAVQALSFLPPSVGRLEIVDPRMPSPLDEPGIDLSPVALPWLRDLRLRLPRLARAPEALDALERLELCAWEVAALVRPLPALQELHVWTGMGWETLRALIAGAPHLRTLGLHHPGTLTELLEHIALPQGLEELVLAVPRASPTEIEVLRAHLPDTVRTVRLPFVALQSPLLAPFTSTPDPDHPLYLP